jgi:hypothetical protein
VSSSDFPPTTQQVAMADELKQQGDKYQAQLQQVLSQDLAQFNAMLRDRNVPNIIPNPPRVRAAAAGGQ